MSTQTIAVGLDPEIEIGHVGGDLTIEGWDRPELEARGDDLSQLENHDEKTIISCAGDLNLSLPQKSRLVITFVGGDLRLENVHGQIELSFVGGDAHLQNLTGQVSVTGILGGETIMENVIKLSMDGSRSAGLPDLTAKIKRKVDEATRRAERKVRDVERQVRVTETKMHNVERISHHFGHPRPPKPPVPPRGPSARNVYFAFDPTGSVESREPVSDEERMAVLKMLQEKKITSDQADKLLSALEGGAS